MAIEKRIGAYSAYAIAVRHGFVGTEEEWLESLIGKTGAQGWSVKSAKISADGKLIFTIENPATGEIKDLPSLDIDELNAIEAVEGAQTAALNAISEAQTQATEAVGTAKTQALQAVEGAENTGVSAVEDAKSNALTEVGKAKTTAVDAVNAAGTQAASDTQTAITAAKNQAVSDVQSAGQSAVSAVGDAQTTAVEAVEDAQTNAVQAVQNAGTAEIEKINDILPVPTAEDAGKVPIAKPDGSGYELGSQIDDAQTAETTTWSSENILSRLCPPFTTEGAIVTCQPVEGSRLNTVVKIEPIQEGEGDPSPENVRAIKGLDVVNIWRGGTNLIDYTKSQVRTSSVFQSIEILDNAVKFTGDYYFYIPATHLKTNTDYVFGCEGEDAGSWTLMYNPTGYYQPFPNVGTSCNPKNNVIKNVAVYKKDPVTPKEDMVFSNIQLNFGTEVLPYEPYRGETFTISLGQMVYGGILDIGSGVLTKTHECIQSYAGEDVGDDWISSTGSLTLGAQVVYRLPQPEIIHLNLQRIYALSGTNTLYADSGNITISGYSDPKAIIHTLSERLSALEQNAIGG